MPGTPMPYVRVQFLTDDGLPAEGYQLFSYEAGTTTKLATYSDVALTSANTNPIVLDSAGSATIFLAADSYKFVLCLPTETDPPTGTAVWTRDNVTAVPELNANLDIAGVAGENLAAGEFVYCSAGDGGRTAGRWYKADADLTYGSTGATGLGCVVSTTITAAATGNIRLQGRVTGLSGLTAGSLYYISATAGGITATAPTNARAVGIADTTTSLVFSQWAPTQVATYALQGIVSTGTQSIGGEKTFYQTPRYRPGGSAPTQAAYVSGCLNVDINDAAGVMSAGADETDLFTYTVPANTLSARASGIYPSLRIKWRMGFANDADAKVVKLYFAGTSVTVVNNACQLASNVGIFTGDVVVIDATTGYISGSGIVSTSAGTAASGFYFANSANIAAFDLTIDNVLKITGDGVNANDILLYWTVVETIG